MGNSESTVPLPYIDSESVLCDEVTKKEKPCKNIAYNRTTKCFIHLRSWEIVEPSGVPLSMFHATKINNVEHILKSKFMMNQVDRFYYLNESKTNSSFSNLEGIGHPERVWTPDTLCPESFPGVYLRPVFTGDTSSRIEKLLNEDTIMFVFPGNFAKRGDFHVNWADLFGHLSEDDTLTADEFLTTLSTGIDGKFRFMDREIVFHHSIPLPKYLCECWVDNRRTARLLRIVLNKFKWASDIPVRVINDRVVQRKLVGPVPKKLKPLYCECTTSNDIYSKDMAKTCGVKDALLINNKTILRMEMRKRMAKLYATLRNPRIKPMK